MAYTWCYYDVMLLGIVASLVVGAGVGFATPVPLTVAVAVFGLLAIAIIGHGLFVNGPIDEFVDVMEEVQAEEIPGVAMATQVIG